ncbi:MAG TPA: DUF3472 domain-containing protein [Verrucomicrobiae bacterium]|nr:DUF3472 domain-containing protein [Verrucomicrobiae bacterium]
MAPITSTNQPPKAARSVHLVYDAVQADMYYAEMRIDEATDNSFFVPCAWENGYFGLQQFDGENKRAFNFAVWNRSDDRVLEPDRAVEVLYSNPSVVVKRLTGKGGGVQCMRQMDWATGETNRFALQAQVQGDKTAYTAWLFDARTGTWERLATVRALSMGVWMRGFYSFIEDFRRDFKSAQETRRARFGNIWAHQNEGSFVAIKQAMFTVSSLRNEAAEAVDAGQLPGAFTLATGGPIQKKQKIGSNIRLLDIPLREQTAPDLWFLYNPPELKP